MYYVNKRKYINQVFTIMKKIFVIFLLIFCAVGTFAQSSPKSIAISRAKELFIATANGDVAKIKRLTTSAFYKEKYPYSDAKVRELLLRVPYEKRKRMIDQIRNHSKASAIINRAGDVVTVTLKNDVTGKEFLIRLIDENGNGNWRVSDYDY